MALSPEALDDVMTALSDQTRRAILERLFEGEARVTDLAKPFAMSLNSVSKHIRILERARLVTRRKSGRDHFLSFNPDVFKDATAWMNARADKGAHSAAKANDNADADAPEKTGVIDSFTALMKADAKKKKRWSLFGGV